MNSSAAEQWHAVDVASIVVEAPSDRVGALLYRGGVEMRADDLTFRGISGIEVLRNGAFIAISDESDWIEGRLVHDEGGRLIAVSNIRTAWMHDETGRPLFGKQEADSEGLTQLLDGRFAVSFERSNLLRIYDINRDGPFRAASRGPVLAGVDALPWNAGLEALSTTADGSLLAGVEGGDRATTLLWLAPLGAAGAVPPRYLYPIRDGYSLTALDRLADGRFVAIERFYAPVVGARARITRFALPEQGGRIEPEVLAELRSPFPVDNFEGVSAIETEDGVTRLYIVADNNGQSRQRSLLLAFEIAEPAPVTPPRSR